MKVKPFARIVAMLLASLVLGGIPLSWGGTSSAVCGVSGGVGLAIGASQDVGLHHYILVENQAGTMGATSAGNLVFAASNGVRFRAAKVTGTNAAFSPISPANGGRVLVTGGNGKATLPSAAAGTGQIVLGGVVFSAVYTVEAVADTLTISNDAGVASTSVISSAATAGPDLTYGEFAAALANAINSVFWHSAPISAAMDSGAGGLVSYTNLAADAPAHLTLDADAALTGGSAPILLSSGLTAVAASVNAAPVKYIDSDFKLVVPYAYAPGAKAAQLTLANIVFDTRYATYGTSVNILLDPSTTTSGVTLGAGSSIAVLRTDVAFTQLLCSSTSFGTASGQTMVMQIYVDPLSEGRTGNYYAAARLADGRVYFMNSAGDFVLYSGGSFPVFATGILSDRAVLVLSNGDAASLSGTVVYAGYGADDASLLMNGTYNAAGLN